MIGKCLHNTQQIGVESRNYNEYLQRAKIPLMQKRKSESKMELVGVYLKDTVDPKLNLRINGQTFKSDTLITSCSSGQVIGLM